MNDKRFNPYQPGDFVEHKPLSGELRAVDYLGPIYTLEYPPGTEEMQEMFDWTSLGYRMPTSNTHVAGESFILTILGDIPEWFQDKLRENQVKINLQRERGQISFV